jgi:ribonuclease HI
MRDEWTASEAKVSRRPIIMAEPPPGPVPLLEIWTDGSCEGNGRGGFADGGAFAGSGVFFGEGDPRNVARPVGPEDGPAPTNQLAELVALHLALEAACAELAAGRCAAVRIHTDSAYSRSCLTEWAAGWARNGWRNSKGQPVAHRRWIEPAVQMLRRWEGCIEVAKIKAHAGHAGNEAADALARAGTAAARKAAGVVASEGPLERAPKKEAAAAASQPAAGGPSPAPPPSPQPPEGASEGRAKRAPKEAHTRRASKEAGPQSSQRQGGGAWASEAKEAVWASEPKAKEAGRPRKRAAPTPRREEEAMVRTKSGKKAAFGSGSGSGASRSGPDGPWAGPAATGTGASGASPEGGPHFPEALVTAFDAHEALLAAPSLLRPPPTVPAALRADVADPRTRAAFDVAGAWQRRGGAAVAAGSVRMGSRSVLLVVLPEEAAHGAACPAGTPPSAAVAAPRK